MNSTLLSWGRYPRHPQTGHGVQWPDEIPGTLASVAALNLGRVLPYGKGRSYGDSCLAESGQVLAMSGMDRIIAADWTTGLITARKSRTTR